MNKASDTAAVPPRGRLQLLLLWLVPLGLMAAAGVAYQLVVAGHLSLGSKNQGQLIQPPLQWGELAPTTSIDNEEAGSWKGRCRIVVRGDERCEGACREALQLTRQIHIRLDKSANRVQRVYLSDERPLTAEFEAHLAEQHHYLQHRVAGDEALAQLDARLQDAQGRPAAFFLVDPAGWAMMYYRADHLGGEVLQDLKHLLKYSQER